MNKILYVAVILLSTIYSISMSARQKEVSRSQSDKAEYLFMEACNLDNKGNHDAAFDLLRRAEALDPANAEINYWLSLYYYHMGEDSVSTHYAMAAADANPDNYWYNIGAANMLVNINDTENALRLYKRMLNNDPTDESLYRYMSEAYLAAEDYTSALECYDNIERLTGDVYYATMMKIALLERLERKDEVLEAVKRLYRTNPENMEYKLMLFSEYLEADSIEQGKAIMDEIEAEHPENCLLPMAKVNYYVAVNDEDSLQTAIFEAFECPDLELDAKLEILKNFIYVLLQKNNDMGSFHKVDQLFLSLTDSYPRSSEVRNMYTEVLLMQEKYAEAEEQIRVSLDLDPDNQAVWKKLIGTLYNQQSYDAMDKAVDESLEYFENDSTYLMTAGTFYFYAGQEDKALKTLGSAASKMARNPIQLSDIYALMGDIFYNQNKVDSSYIYYEKSVTYNPHNLGALNNYSYYMAQSGGDLKKAEKMSAITVAEEPNNSTFLDTYGWIFFKQGNYMLAELYIKRALDNSEEAIPEIYDHYGDILYKQGKTVEALQYWKKAQESGLDTETLKKKIETQQYIEQ